MDQPFLQEADRIASGIPDMLQSGGHHSLIDDADRPSMHRKGSETVFSGWISPPLVLLELSRHTGNDRYLSVARDLILKAAARLDLNDCVNFSLYNGSMSVGYALTRLSVLTRQQQYLDIALDIAKKCSERFLHHPYASDALFNGRAGALLALLDLYSVSRERWLLEKIHLFASRIVKNAINTDHGIYWSATNRKASETGLGYGASGIGLAMLELGHFFDNDAYYAVAEAAFSYEDHFWDDHIGNWTAVSREIENLEQWQLHYRKFSAGEYGFFEEPTDDISYVRGCMGMGLARLRAWKLLQRPAYHEKVVKSCRRLTAAPEGKRASWSPEERINAGAFLLEVYNVTGLGQYLEQAQVIAGEAQQYVTKMIMTAKMNGAALLPELPTGMTHLLLQLYSASSSPFFPVTSESEPVTRKDAYPYLDLALPEVHRLLVERDFYRTIYLLEYIDGQGVRAHFRQIPPPGGERESFITFVRDRIPRERQRCEQVLAEIFNLEMTKVRIADINQNAALLYMKEQLEMEQAAAVLQLGEKQLLETPIALNENVTFVRTIVHPDLDTLRIPDDYDFYSDQPFTTALKPAAQKTCGREIRDTFTRGMQRFKHDRVREIHLNGIQVRLIDNLKGTPRIWEWLDKTISDPGYPVNRRIHALETAKNLLAAGIVKPLLLTDIH